jgi:hypothetical protein
MAGIQPYATYVVSQHYKALTNFKVGAIRSCGVDSQYDLMGALHCNYHDNVNKKVPNEHPQSVIMALDPFDVSRLERYPTNVLLVCLTKVRC